MISIRAEARPREIKSWKRGLLYACPLGAFGLSVPALLASLPTPRTEIDYLVVGSAATFFGLLIALLIVTLGQVSKFERVLSGPNTLGVPKFPGNARS